MSIKLSCGACGASLRAEWETAGKVKECPRCKAMVRVPIPKGADLPDPVPKIIRDQQGAEGSSAAISISIVAPGAWYIRLMRRHAAGFVAVHLLIGSLVAAWFLTQSRHHPHGPFPSVSEIRERLRDVSYWPVEGPKPDVLRGRPLLKVVFARDASEVDCELAVYCDAEAIVRGISIDFECQLAADMRIAGGMERSKAARKCEGDQFAAARAVFGKELFRDLIFANGDPDDGMLDIARGMTGVRHAVANTTKLWKDGLYIEVHRFGIPARGRPEATEVHSGLIIIRDEAW